MALRSEMLRDEQALQACLISDPAHVVPGARGPHVAKIQSALLLLERTLSIPTSELRAKHYGPSTASAVLAFKTKRKIINPAYQSTPDAIVGKMTIARIDDELFALEQKPNPGRSVCRGTTRPIITSPQLETRQLVGAPRRTFRTAQISVVFHETDAAVEAGGGPLLLFGLFQKARELLAPHALDFAGGAGGPLPLIGPRIPDFEQVIPGSPASCFSVRAAAERVLPNRPNVLRVIFCPFSDKGKAFGVTDVGQAREWTFPKFCLINVRTANPDHGTLVHEMIHASHPEPFFDHDRDPTSVFSESIGGRTHLPLIHAESIAKAFYSTILL